MKTTVYEQTYPDKRPLGMRGDLAPDKISPDEMELCQGVFTDEGTYKSQNIGTGVTLHAGAIAADVYNKTRFRSSKGVNYIIGFTSDGKIIYTSSDWSDWTSGTSVAKYAESADGTALVLESGITGAPHIIPAIVVRSNNDVIISNGIDSVYRIDGTVWPTSGKLKATIVTTLMPFIKGIFLQGHTIATDGERVFISAPADPDRFYSTIVERGAGSWNDNHWITPAAEGVSGFITAIRGLNESSCIVTTTDGIYWYGLDLDSNGMVVENMIPLLTDAGCPSGACCIMLGKVCFESDYNGGTLLGMKRGAPSQSEGTPIALDAKNGWSVYEAAPGLRKLLALIRPSDFSLAHTGVMGTRQDWEKIPAGARSGIETLVDPGWIFLNALTESAYTVSYSVVWWSGNGNVMDFNTMGLPYMNDAAPLDPSETTPTPTYFRITCLANAYLATGEIPKITVDGTNIFTLGFGGGWSNWATIPVFRVCSNIGFHWWYDSGQGISSYIQVVLTLTGGQRYVSELRIFGLTYAGTPGVVAGSNLINFGEVRVLGAKTDSATWIGEIEEVTGLTPSSDLDMGRIRSVIRAISEEKFPTVQVRVGKNKSMDAIGAASTTTQAITVSPAMTTITVAAVNAGVAVGDQMTISKAGQTTETAYIVAINSLTLTVSKAFAYVHDSGSAVAYTGTASTQVNWSAWCTALTLAELQIGKKIADLTINGATPKSDSSGKFWTQTKISLLLDLVKGLSPAVSVCKCDFLHGTLPLSNHLMNAASDDHFILACPGSSGSTDNDTTFVHNIVTGASMYVVGQHIYSIVQLAKDFIVNTGRQMAKLWNGDYNYFGTSSTDTALTRRIKWRKERGRALQGQECNVDIVKFNETVIIPRTNVLTIDSDAYRFYNRGAATATYQPWGTSANAYGLNSQLTQAVNTGDAVYWIHPTGPTAGNQTALFLLRFKDGVVTTVKTLVASATNYCGGDMTWDGEYLWIAYWSYNNPLSGSVYKVTKYNPATGDSHDYSPMTNLTASTAYICFGCCIKYRDGVVHLQACMMIASGVTTTSYYTNSLNAFATGTAVPVTLVEPYEYPMWIVDHLGCLQLVQLQGIVGQSTNTGVIRGCRLVSVASDGTPTWSTTNVVAFTSLSSEQIKMYSVYFDAALNQYVVMYTTTTEYSRFYTGTTANVWTRRDSGNNATIAQLKITRLSNGHILFLYLKRDSTLWYYRIWDGTTLGAATSTAIAGANNVSQMQYLAADDPDVIWWLCFNNAGTPLLQVYEIRNYELLGNSGMGQLYLNTDTEHLPIDSIQSPKSNVKMPDSSGLPFSGDTKTLQLEFTADVPFEISGAKLLYKDMET